MSKLLKVCRILFSILTLCVAACFFLAIYGSRLFDGRVERLFRWCYGFTEWKYSPYIIGAVCALLGLGALILLIATLVKPTSAHSLTLALDGGKICLTDQAIETYVKKSLEEFWQIRESNVRCRIYKSGKTRVATDIQMALDTDRDVKTIAQDVQTKVLEDLRQFLGNDVAEVNITVSRSYGKGKEQAAVSPDSSYVYLADDLDEVIKEKDEAQGDLSTRVE